MDHLPHWDFSKVYPSLESAEYGQAVARLKARLDQLDAWLAEQQIGPEGAIPGEPPHLAALLAGYLERMNPALRLAYTLQSFVRGTVTTDSFDTTARRLLSELEALLVRAESQEVRVRGWIGAVARRPGLLDAALEQPGAPHEHAFYLGEMAEQSRYLMSGPEEDLAADLSLSGPRAWQDLQGVITSQLQVPLERDGRVQLLPMTVLQNLRSDPDEDLRRRAHEAEVAAWRSAQEPLAACLNGVKGAVGTLDRRRGRSDALHAALDKSRIDRATLEAMLGAMRDSFPAFRRYWRAKARLLGKDVLAWWDLSAPVGGSGRTYSFAEARDLILEHLGAFWPRLGALCRRAFDGGWIDAEPRAGKRGGAFCMGLPAVEESRILCQFDGSLDQVFTLAHELGHAYHNECQAGREPLQRRTPMTLAETASIMNETVLTEAVLREATGPGEELGILEAFLAGSAQVIVDIYSRFLFEKEVFERRAAAALSAADLCEIMTRAQRESYGDALDTTTLHPYMWAWKPHYYRPELSFYNYPYAFGLLFGLGLYTVYRQQGAAFLPAYDDLLRTTGEASAAELAGRFGIDIRQRAFWEGALDVVRARVERYCLLQRGLVRPA